MCLSDFSDLTDAINKCDPYAGILRQLSAICTTLNNLIGVNQCNVNAGSTVLTPATLTVLEISDSTVLEVPVGSLVGDTLIAEYTGLYFENVVLNIPTSGNVETLIFDVLVNGIPVHSISINDDGINPMIYANTFYNSLDAGDVVSFSITSPTGVTVTHTTRFEAVYGT